MCGKDERRGKLAAVIRLSIRCGNIWRSLVAALTSFPSKPSSLEIFEACFKKKILPGASGSLLKTAFLLREEETTILMESASWIWKAHLLSSLTSSRLQKV